jgi:hypothetical protein
MPESVLEIGYGTGSFIEAASMAGIPYCAGFDIARYPLPAGCTFLEWEEALLQDWDLIALFDVLEHIPDLSFLGKIKAKNIALAVPYCRWHELGDDWFRDWRMRLPDEHLHHFNSDSIQQFMSFFGYQCLELNTFEDGLRLRKGESGPNILLGFFTKAGVA